MEILKTDGKPVLKLNKNEFGILMTCVSHVEVGLSDGDFLNEIGKEKNIVIEADKIFHSIIRAQLKEMGRL